MISGLLRLCSGLDGHGTCRCRVHEYASVKGGCQLDGGFAEVALGGASAAGSGVVSDLTDLDRDCGGGCELVNAVVRGTRSLAWARADEGDRHRSTVRAEQGADARPMERSGGAANRDDGATASTAAGFATPSNVNSHAGSTLVPRSVKNGAEPNRAAVITSGVSGPGTPPAGVPSERITASASPADITGYSAAAWGPDGSVGGATKAPERNASFASVVRKPEAGAVTGSSSKTRGLGAAWIGNADHASKAARND